VQGLRPYYGAGAWYSGGSKLGVRYISYQSQTFLTRSEAEAYLAWLDAGNVGRHYRSLEGGGA